ncbi:chromo domain-containing protein LHP1 isoform X2 [Tripterygium wilfordii]|uniref:Chromo domain-containing protein LHP1 isoform X2 n=1 Tax=Tripterygium wilfordii TaxID=458696 RepID=A0A7J7BVB0_TRIWF|nr:chromo domain-containing protein LHP1-like [Tripterygium wilfordii]KAF5725768.1 chromo domain-containing protein LHP1 isoform X2 [Tripterygium wilfordii]
MKGKKKATPNPNYIGFIVEAEASNTGEFDTQLKLPEQQREGGEAEEEEEEGEEGEGGVDGEEREGEEEEEERPKLADGFYEIEAIRRRRVRKGELQYLIKWRGWPETANTWEPLENLQSIPDVVDAFEESLQSGKSSRKRKRNYGGSHSQPKKKQPHSLVAVYNVADFTGSGLEVENNGNTHNVRTLMQGDENWFARIHGRKDDNEHDPKLSELKGTLSTNEVSTDKLAVHFHEGKAPENDGPANDLPKINHMEAVQSNHRTGARKRKSGSVKRFRPDSACFEPAFGQYSASNGCNGLLPPVGIENPDLIGDTSGLMPMFDGSFVASSITKIIKPIGYSTSVSDNVQDVLVTFLALRSDGKEVMVDNQFLKASNPLLLINFYEQHLRYNPAS